MAGFADSPRADLALFIIAFAESSFFPIPPDVLLLALAFARPRRAFRYALICTAGSVLGGAFGYVLGRYLLRFAAVEAVQWIGLGDQFAAAGALYQRWDVWAVGVAAFTFIPYKVFTILAGFFYLDFWRFLVASLLGRGGRFFAVAVVIRMLGPRVRPWIERYLEWVALVLGILLVVGFLLVGHLTSGKIEATPEEQGDRIDALKSDDVEIRREAIRFLLESAHVFFGFNPDGPQEERDRAREKWVEWFDSEHPGVPVGEGGK